MEETLRDLQLVMDAHRKALAETPAPPGEAAVDRPVPPDRRQVVMHRLARDIERVSGIEITGAMETKLGRVLSSVDLVELDRWVSQLHRLPADDPEWLSLVESLTVHETFFHRDRSQLELLALILPEIIARAARVGHHSLRLWSAGCATGEEAYTLAILALLALRDAGFADQEADGGIVCRAPWRVDVLGSDISRLVLAQAKAAVYPTEGLSAFRDLPRKLQRCFPVLPKTGEAGETERRGVLPSVRRHVRFRQFNLLASAPPDLGFDVVLCRNVLIYLTAAARVAVQAMVKQALRPGGYLLLGPTDSLAEPSAYSARWGAGAVAYALKARDG
ncbi:MAG TPA: CheR family methyltransferase [Stellaceae bacterium]|nr:CheR family methyltransferase [Stellaceae bacterium]